MRLSEERLDDLLLYYKLGRKVPTMTTKVPYNDVRMLITALREAYTREDRVRALCETPTTEFHQDTAAIVEIQTILDEDKP